MITGKIQDIVLGRSVMTKLDRRCGSVVVPPGIGRDFGAVTLDDGTILMTHMHTMCGDAYECGQLAVWAAVNGLMAHGAKLTGITVSITMPEDTTEPQLRELMALLEQSCRRLDIQILGGHTTVSPAVSEMIVSVCAEGTAPSADRLTQLTLRDGDDLVMTGWAGLSGTAVIARRAGSQLYEKYHPGFIDGTQQFFEAADVRPAAALLDDFDISGVKDVSSTGIYGALWEMAAAGGAGFEVYLKKIPLRQETVEICNYFDINPYRLESAGALLVALDHGGRFVQACHKAGVHAAVIGTVVSGNKKLIINDEETSCMEAPRGSEMAKIDWRNQR